MIDLPTNVNETKLMVWSRNVKLKNKNKTSSWSSTIKCGLSWEVLENHQTLFPTNPERSQAVHFKDVLSEAHPVFTGVPQGSILGPILLIIHFNNVYMLLQFSKIITYADVSVRRNLSEEINNNLCHCRISLLMAINHYNSSKAKLPQVFRSLDIACQISTFSHHVFI